MNRLAAAGGLALALTACGRTRTDDAAPVATASSKPAPTSTAEAQRAKRIDDAIRRAIVHLRPRVATLDPRIALVLAYPQRKFAPPGLPAMAKRVSNEGEGIARAFATLFGRLVDPNTKADVRAIAGLETDIDRMTATALYCDQIGTPPDFAKTIARLTELDDNYSLPHAMMATGWATENGCIDPTVGASLRARQAQRVEERVGPLNQSLPIEDWRIEHIVFLYYLGQGSHVRPEWVDAVLDAQLPSGGWANGMTGAGEDDHTTALALWMLLEAAHPDAPSVGWIPRR